MSSLMSRSRAFCTAQQITANSPRELPMQSSRENFLLRINIGCLNRIDSDMALAIKSPARMAILTPRVRVAVPAPRLRPTAASPGHGGSFLLPVDTTPGFSLCVLGNQSCAYPPFVSPVGMGSERDEVREALTAFMGADRATRFSVAELDLLHRNGYTTEQDLQDAPESSLHAIGLLRARIDAIMAAHGEPTSQTGYCTGHFSPAATHAPHEHMLLHVTLSPLPRMCTRFRPSHRHPRTCCTHLPCPACTGTGMRTCCHSHCNPCPETLALMAALLSLCPLLCPPFLLFFVPPYP